MEKKKYTLITGASMGIGKAFAMECASRGMNLVLVALPEPALENTKMEIEDRYDRDILVFGVDLTTADAAERVFAFCIHHNVTINMLINNAGMGAGGRFENIPYKVYFNMMALNNQAMVGMTLQFLPMLKEQGAGFILNMSSMEATLPLPYKSVYTGTKNFVYAFSLAIREELASQNIKVSVVCPGPVMTNPDSLKRMNAHGYRAKLVTQTPEEVAALSIKNLLKGKAVSVPGNLNWTIVKVTKYIPTKWKMKLLERVFRVYSEH